MDRVVIDVGADGVRVSALVDGATFSEPADPVAWSSPLDADALTDVRWYLEDYLRAPFAVYEDRGKRVAATLKSHGESLFNSLFASGTGRDAYVDARARGGPGEIVIRSADGAVLGLPWELLWDAALAAPLALNGAAITRMLPNQVPGRRFTAGGEKLRVLMVIARPDGDRDVGYQMVARRLLPLLDGVRGKVELTVLRPPTLAEFERVVTAAATAGAPFQVVHFDGHGAFASPINANARGGADFSSEMFAMNASGMLAFEAPGGGADLVDADRVSRVLAAGQVPLVVLNACQSGQVGAVVEAGVATRLLKGGASSVVAMAYSVYAVAAAEFMAVFYERLFAGDTVSAAVGAARRHLSVANRRPSPAGRLELADWMVPVHYARTDLSFPHLKTSETPAPGRESLTAIMDRVRNSAAEPSTANSASADSPSQQWAAVNGVFVGRDNLLHALDTAARLQHVVVLHGSGGAGKTEAAKALGRWWRDTGGVENPDWVVWHSFEPGVATFGLDGAVTAAGLHIFGNEFALLAEPAQRRAALLGALEKHRILLVWDNFESVYTLPDPTGATAPLDADQRTDMADFLDHVRTRGTGSVLITSRNPEDWLGREVRRIKVGGLNPIDAAEYTDRLLQPYPAAQVRRKERSFGDLVEWLDGHPLSMRLTLPQLDNTSPADVLAALRGLTPLTNDDEQAGRTASLTASVAYSFTHLAEADRDALTILSLLHGVAFAGVLTTFSGLDGVPVRFRGINGENWRRILDSAANLGLLTPIDSGMYRIHPALPAYLAARWRDAHASAADFEAERERAMSNLLNAHVTFCDWLSQQLMGKNAASAVTMIEEQRRTFGALFGYALDHELWLEARSIAEPLNTYWDLRGLTSEASGWVDRARTELETPDGTPPGIDTDAGDLFMYLVCSEANRQIKYRRFEQAEATYQGIEDALEAQNASSQFQAQLAANHHNLGVIAQERGDLDTAERRFRSSLAIREELGDTAGTATAHHQLGMVALARDDLDAAAQWHRRAVAAFEELGNLANAAIAYHQLGIVMREQGDLDAAGRCHQRSLTIKLQLGDLLGAAGSYYELGTVALERGQFDAAEELYRRALIAFEQLGNRAGAASSYHQLGNVARDRRDLDAAEEWYRRSLSLKELIGNRPGAALSHDQLARVAWYRGNSHLAFQEAVRCVSLFEQFPHPSTGLGPETLRSLTAELGIEALERAWREVTGEPLPPAVRAYVTGA